MKCIFFLIKTLKDKDTITLLNEAVNQFERGDIVLMKTLILMDYEDRLKTKEQYELKFDTVSFILSSFQPLVLILYNNFEDLKKGLIKVLDKDYEILVNALLTDSNAIEVDRIYEALYVSVLKIFYYFLSDLLPSILYQNLLLVLF